MGAGIAQVSVAKGYQVLLKVMLRTTYPIHAQPTSQDVNSAYLGRGLE